MCGRFSLVSPAVLLAKILQLNRAIPLEPRYNIAPTQAIIAIRRLPDDRQLDWVWLRWGLVPSWSKDPSHAGALINARAETVFEKPAFRSPIRQRRCLIPADGFFEWKKQSRQKIPFCFRLRDESPFAFAGLWDHWPGETPIESAAIITTPANALVQPFHSRMPVILDEKDYDVWLNPQVHDPERLYPLLRPFPSERMTAYPVDSRVNNAAFDDPQCILPIS